MGIRKWYKWFLIIWALSGLPILIMSFGFGNPFHVPDPKYVDDVAIAAWALTMSYIVSPLPLAPFGIRFGR
jgi:hypothetical protein